MRSGRGKCPQCKETIVVDLDAAEIRCPYCHALLKKSKKTVAEVRAEEEARIAAAEARERALRGEPEEVAAEPAAEPVAEVPAEPVVETPVEETLPETPAEEAAEAPAEEVAEAPAEEVVDEIGMTDEELAALDETLSTEESAPAEAAAEPVDEIGISDEELAAMDDVPATEEALSEEPIDIPAESGDSDDLSVMAGVAMDEPTAETDGREEALTDEDIAAMDDGIPTLEESEDDAPIVGAAAPYVPSEDAAAEPAEESIPVEAPAEEPAEEAEVPVEATEESVEIADEEATEESVTLPEDAPEEAPLAEEADLPAEEAEEAVAEENPAEAVPAEIAEEESAEAELEEPVEETPEVIPEDAPAEETPAEDAGYTDEDMAFAASLSDGINAGDKGEKKGGYVAPVVTARPASTRGDKADAPKGDAPKGDKKMDGTAIYKKPVAVIMMILAFIGAAISLLFINIKIFDLINADFGGKVADIAAKILDVVPMGETMVSLVFGGVMLLISILGLTGKRGKPGFFFALLASLLFLAEKVFIGDDALVKVQAITDLYAKFGEYVPYAIYGLLLLGAIGFVVSIVVGKEELEFSGATAILPILYVLVAVGAYVALVALPFVTTFEVKAEYIKYAIFGIVGLSILLTLIGVHSATASRGANAWLLFAAAVIVALLYAADVVLDKVVTSKGGEINQQVRAIVTTVIPSILFFPLIGYTISDMRN